MFSFGNIIFLLDTFFEAWCWFYIDSYLSLYLVFILWKVDLMNCLNFDMKGNEFCTCRCYLGKVSYSITRIVYEFVFNTLIIWNTKYTSNRSKLVYYLRVIKIVIAEMHSSIIEAVYMPGSLNWIYRNHISILYHLCLLS